MYTHFFTVTRNVVFDKSLQQLVNYIIGTVVHDSFISNKAHKQVTCILSSKKYRKTTFKFREKCYQNISKFIILYLNMVDL